MALKLLIWMSGTLATVTGSWVASKISVYHHNRNAHLKEIQQRVLAPIKERLAEHCGRTVIALDPILSVGRGSARAPSKSTIKPGCVGYAPMEVERLRLHRGRKSSAWFKSSTSYSRPKPTERTLSVSSFLD